MREIRLVREFAKEGLSQSRTVAALKELYGIEVTYGQLTGLVTRQKIKFFGQPGGPYGNQYWKLRKGNK
jgi:hypothetical protein